MPQLELTAEAIIAAIDAAQGKSISHADLVSTLQAQGYRNIGRTLLDFKRSGAFTGTTDFNGVDKPVLKYTLNS